jgi:hypothetical protein
MNSNVERATVTNPDVGPSIAAATEEGYGFLSCVLQCHYKNEQVKKKKQIRNLESNAFVYIFLFSLRT